MSLLPELCDHTTAGAKGVLPTVDVNWVSALRYLGREILRVLALLRPTIAG